MIGGRKIISGIVLVILMAVVANADMVSMSGTVEASRTAQNVSGERCGQIVNSFDSLIGVSITDFDCLPAVSLPAEIDQSSQNTSTTASLNLQNEPGSLNMCLYALVGLGLCSSVHWVKKTHLSFIPEWYHDGSPGQIGHSFAISPDTLCPVPVCCFIQPESIIANLYISNKYRLGTIKSLWRKSQFIPEVTASRGPPAIQ